MQTRIIYTDPDEVQIELNGRVYVGLIHEYGGKDWDWYRATGGPSIPNPSEPDVEYHRLVDPFDYYRICDKHRVTLLNSIVRLLDLSA